MSEPTQAVATLRILNQKGRSLKVRGKSGVHVFTKAPNGSGLIKEFTSMDEFESVERDIRLNRLNPFAIVTSIAGNDPVRNAKEGVDRLIQERRTVMKTARLEALTEIRATIDAAIEALNAAPADEPDPEPVNEEQAWPAPKFLRQEVPVFDPEKVVEVPEDPNADDPLLYAPPSTPSGPSVEIEVMPEAPAPIIAQIGEELAQASTDVPADPDKYTQPQLVEMKWGQFRKLASEKYGIPVGPRNDMIEAFLAKQG